MAVTGPAHPQSTTHASSNRVGWILAAVLITATAGIVAAFSPGGQASAQDDATGEGAEVYAATCASCHQADGSGIPGSFPPLRGNANSADVAYVESVVQDGLSGPLEVDGVAYDAVMPAIDMSAAERSSVAAYVATLAEAVDTTETTEPAPPEPGEPSRGQSLYEGAARFDNGGAACASCHIAGEVGNFGGTSLGPDLTDVYTRLGGEEGLAAWLASPPSPVMAPIFDNRPLTDPEIADIVAFLGVAPEQQKASPPVDLLVVGGLVGLVVLIGGMAIAWRGMRQTYVERLRSGQ